MPAGADLPGPAGCDVGMVRGMLADSTIAAAVRDGHLGIEPFDPARLQPASYDLTLADEFLVPVPQDSPVDLANIPSGITERVVVSAEEGFVLEPGGFVLARTVEKVKVPGDLLGQVQGRSSLGRCGLTAHVTAGFIDSGFEGTIVLECANLSPWDLRLRPGMGIAQIQFIHCSGRVRRPYGHPELGSKYQGQVEVTAATGTR